MTTEPTPPPPLHPAPAYGQPADAPPADEAPGGSAPVGWVPGAQAAGAHRGKKVASALISSAMLLFGLVFTPIGIAVAVNSRPFGAEWSTGSNMINVVFTFVFGVALLVLSAVALTAVFLARAARSTGLFVYALAVTAIVLAGAIAWIAAGVIMVSG